jgi:hypothetical protein
MLFVSAASGAASVVDLSVAGVCLSPRCATACLSPLLAPAPFGRPPIEATPRVCIGGPRARRAHAASSQRERAPHPPTGSYGRPRPPAAWSRPVLTRLPPCRPPPQPLLPAMFTARTKIVKDRADQEPTELEDDVAKALFELQEQVGRCLSPALRCCLPPSLPLQAAAACWGGSTWCIPTRPRTVRRSTWRIPACHF